MAPSRNGLLLALLIPAGLVTAALPRRSGLSPVSARALLDGSEEVRSARLTTARAW
jgi:hypothetical protein